VKARASGGLSRAAVFCGAGAFALASAMACGGPRKGADEPSAGSSDEPSHGTPWKDKSREQRMDWMGLAVFPKMRSRFIEHDSKEYSSFDCQTCHGKDMELVDFKMPNQLFSLPKDKTIDWAKDYDAEMAQFMVDVVVPEMASLLDMAPYDADTGKGFGCFGCHPAEAE